MLSPPFKKQKKQREASYVLQGPQGRGPFFPAFFTSCCRNGDGNE